LDEKTADRYVDYWTIYFDFSIDNSCGSYLEAFFRYMTDFLSTKEEMSFNILAQDCKNIRRLYDLVIMLDKELHDADLKRWREVVKKQQHYGGSEK
jgi:hypothetical protein